MAYSERREGETAIKSDSSNMPAAVVPADSNAEVWIADDEYYQDATCFMGALHVIFRVFSHLIALCLTLVSLVGMCAGMTARIDVMYGFLSLSAQYRTLYLPFVIVCPVVLVLSLIAHVTVAILPGRDRKAYKVFLGLVLCVLLCVCGVYAYYARSIDLEPDFKRQWESSVTSDSVDACTISAEFQCSGWATLCSSATYDVVDGAASLLHVAEGNQGVMNGCPKCEGENPTYWASTKCSEKVMETADEELSSVQQCSLVMLLVLALLFANCVAVLSES